MNRCWVDFNDVFWAVGAEQADRVTTLASYCARRPEVGERVLADANDDYGPSCEAVVLSITPSAYTPGSEIVLLKLDWSTMKPPPDGPVEWARE